MRKKSASRAVFGKTGNARKTGQEEGICVLCGGQKMGVPAKKDSAILLARKLRRALGMEETHSIACKSCIGVCLQKRAVFESEMRIGRILAAVFLVIILTGGVYFGGFSAWLFVPALVGSAIIVLLPYGKYFPAFAKEAKDD